jgi:hypothetical protein
MKYFASMSSECWPCICWVASINHWTIKGCWSFTHLDIQLFIIIIILSFLEVFAFSLGKMKKISSYLIEKKSVKIVVIFSRIFFKFFVSYKLH